MTCGRETRVCSSVGPGPAGAAEEMNWFAIQTRSRHEKVVARELQAQGVVTFLPVVTRLHRWSDRRKLVELPLFPGYAFVRLLPSPEARLRVLRTDGVVSFVGTNRQATPIPDRQIDEVRVLLSADVPISSHPFLKVGQHVRVRGGSLDGLEGILVSTNGNRNLVISLAPIQRSICIQVEGYQVEPV